MALLSCKTGIRVGAVVGQKRVNYAFTQTKAMEKQYPSFTGLQCILVVLLIGNATLHVLIAPFKPPSKMNWDGFFGYLLPGGVNEELYRFPHRVRRGFGTGERSVR